MLVGHTHRCAVTVRDSWLRRPYSGTLVRQLAAFSVDEIDFAYSEGHGSNLKQYHRLRAAQGIASTRFFGDFRCTQFLCTSQRQRCALILIFADSLPMFRSLRLWQTPGLRYHRQYRLARVDVSVYSAMFGLRLYMLCVILRSSTWAPLVFVVVLFAGLRSLVFRVGTLPAKCLVRPWIHVPRHFMVAFVHDNVPPCFSGCSRFGHSGVRCAGGCRHERAHRLMASMGLSRLDDLSLWTQYSRTAGDTASSSSLTDTERTFRLREANGQVRFGGLFPDWVG